MAKIELPYVIFEVTRQCNLACRYCYNHWKKGEADASETPATYAQAKRTLRQLFKNTKVRHITFTGGEPLLMDRIDELILFCKLRGKTVALITNGNAGTAERYAMLRHIGVSLFEIPLHSDMPEQHDWLTQTPGSWSKACQSIRDIVASGGSVVIVIVLCRTNVLQIESTLRFIADLGVNRVMLNRFNIGGSGIRHQSELLPSPEQLNDAYRIAETMVSELGMSITSNVCTPFCVVNPRHFPLIAFTSCAVGKHGSPITIDTSGDMRVCNHSPYVVGNLYNQSIEEMLNSDYVKCWFNTVPRECYNCSNADVCRGGCRAAAEQCGGTVKDMDPFIPNDIKEQIAKRNLLC